MLQRFTGDSGGWALPIRDDAGAERMLLPIRALPSGTERLNRIRDKAQVVYSELLNIRRMVVRAIVLVLPFCVLLPILMIWLGPLGFSGAWLSAGVILVMIPLSSAWMHRDFKRLAPRAGEIADAFLDEGICPCCAYNLAGAVDASTPGSRLRCAECGAEWNRDRIHHVEADQTHDAREKPSAHSIMRSVGALYSRVGFKDDAGRPISLARQMDLIALRARSEGEHRDRLGACVRALRFRGVWLRLLVASLVFPMLIGILVGLAGRPLSTFGVVQLLQAIGLVVWLIGAIAILRSDIGRAGAPRASLLKSKGVCPACGGVLSGHGRVVCGNCRAVWDLPVPPEHAR